MVKVPHVSLTVLTFVLAGGVVAGGDFESALVRAREAGASHRYGEVIEILTPYNSMDDPEVRYITAAEIGRAYFHLGRYHESHRAFREAVRLRPERAETALYLEATSYLVGERDQSYAILRALLSSGARDLYLALTLPGERRFAADPEVQAIIEEHAIPIAVDLGRGSAHGVTLGDRRDVVVEGLGAQSLDPASPTLTAQAGPALIWAFVFDPEQRLREVILHAENLLRYTPYRLQMDDNLGWQTTPAAAIAVLGPPDDTITSPEQGIAITWLRPTHRITLDFGRPEPPLPSGIPDGVAMLRMVRLEKQSTASAGRMIE